MYKVFLNFDKKTKYNRFRPLTTAYQEHMLQCVKFNVRSYRHTYIDKVAVETTSVGLSQACPNHTLYNSTLGTLSFTVFIIILLPMSNTNCPYTYSSYPHSTINTYCTITVHYITLLASCQFPENGWEDICKATLLSPFEFGMSHIVAYFATRSVTDENLQGIFH